LVWFGLVWFGLVYCLAKSAACFFVSLVNVTGTVSRVKVFIGSLVLVNGALFFVRAVALAIIARMEVKARKEMIVIIGLVNEGEKKKRHPTAQR
jgi:hypothetical protein